MDYAVQRKHFFSKFMKSSNGFKSNDPTKFYTVGEEISNAITHGLGNIL